MKVEQASDSDSGLDSQESDSCTSQATSDEPRIEISLQCLHKHDADIQPTTKEEPEQDADDQTDVTSAIGSDESSAQEDVLLLDENVTSSRHSDVIMIGSDDEVDTKETEPLSSHCDIASSEKQETHVQKPKLRRSNTCRGGKGHKITVAKAKSMKLYRFLYCLRRSYILNDTDFKVVKVLADRIIGVSTPRQTAAHQYRTSLDASVGICVASRITSSSLEKS